MNSPLKLRVFDSSATLECPKRVHDILINGGIMKVAFEVGKPTILDQAVALKFLQPGFTVMHMDRDEVFSETPPANETLEARLGPDEVIARWDELSLPALQIRASVKHGGEKFSVSTDSEAIIRFLKGLKQLADEPKKEEPVEETEEDEEIKVEETDIVEEGPAPFNQEPDADTGLPSTEDADEIDEE